MDKSEILKKIRNLNVNKSGDRRAPHKPLLLLMAIANLQKGHHSLAFLEIENTLRPLLDTYAPPIKNQHQPALPYWHLVSDGLWQINDSDSIPRQRSGFPKIDGLRKTSGHLPNAITKCLEEDPQLTNQIILEILDMHFPESLHEDLKAAIGFDCQEANEVSEESIPYAVRRKRDPNFRTDVLRSYEFRCAATGFRAALSNSYFGCEAAHVQWHAYNGPDAVDNGVALEPTMHKLFDAGAWSLTDDRRILVSAEFTGSDTAVDRLRTLHGTPVNPPLPGFDAISPSYFRWHREPDQGGVFRLPALEL